MSDDALRFPLRRYSSPAVSGSPSIIMGDNLVLDHQDEMENQPMTGKAHQPSRNRKSYYLRCIPHSR